jgi:antitoxin StbD
MEPIMQILLADLAVSMSQFKKNPAAVRRQAAGRPVAVLNHNKVDFYLLEPVLLETLLDEIGRRQTAAPATEPHPPGTRRQQLEALLSQTKAVGR